MEKESSQSFLTSVIVFFTVFLILACLAFHSIYFSLSEKEVESLAESESSVLLSDEEEEEDIAYFYRLDQGEVLLEESDEEESKKLISVTELSFELYRSPKTRLAVEWFYSDLTGNRSVSLAILKNAEKFNIPFPLAFSLAHAESRYKVRAYNVNTNGSVDRGLFQLNSSSFPYLTEEEFFNADTSSYYGLSHLNYCMSLGKNEIVALAMYNAGQGRVKGSGTPFSTLNYIYSIESYKEKIEQNFTLEVLSYYKDTLYLEE